MPLRWLLGYGLGFGVAQFGLLFLAIEQGMPSGLASVVVQASAPFTVLLGALLLRERVSGRQLAGIGLAVLGMVVIAVDRSRTAPLMPLVLTVLAALGWAVGNLASRQAKPEYPLRFALWMAVVPPLLLLALSAVMEGPATGWRALGSAFGPEGWPGLVALVYIAVLGSVVGSGIWTALLKRYPAGVVAPFSMLVPVVGLVGAWLALDERPTGWAVAGGAVVVAGVLLGTGWLPRFARERAAAPRLPEEGGGGRPTGTQTAGATGASQETKRS